MVSPWMPYFVCGQDLTNSDPEWSVINLRYFNPVGAHKSGLIGEDAGPAPKNIFPCLTKTAYGRMREVVVFGNDYNTPDGTGNSLVFPFLVYFHRVQLIVVFLPAFA